MGPYLLALLLVVGSLLVGGAICRACGAPSAIAPAVGLSVLIAVATLALQLPGDAITGAALLLLVVVAAAWWIARTGGRTQGWDLAAILAGVGAAAVTTLQFLSAGHVGLPGMSLNNDTAVHLLWTEGLRSASIRELYPSNDGYPLGPHSLVAAVAQGTGATSEAVLIGLLVATPVLLAVTAALFLRPVNWIFRAPAALFVALTYFGAAWFAQGAFKEPMLSLLVLGFGLGLGSLLTAEVRTRNASLVPLGLIAAGALLTYSYLAVAWLAAIAFLAVVAALLFRWPGRAHLLATARGAVTPVAIGLGVALVAVAVELPRLWRYATAVGSSPASGDGGIGTSNIGNLAGPLPTTEVLGIWPTGDFRFPPAATAFALDELTALALLAAIGGALYLADRRRDAGLLAVLVGSLLVWWISDGGQSPYVTAKSLVILSPVIALVSLRALLPVGAPRALVRRPGAGLRLVAAAALVAGGLWSSQLVLRGSPVESLPQRDQLETMRQLVKGGPTLFMGVDDYAAYRLRGVPTGYLGVGFASALPVGVRKEKPYVYGDPVDWDSVDAATLDRFSYVVSIRSPYGSQAPSNFKLIGQTPLYQAWKRVGPTRSRATIESSDSPAAPLDCKMPAVRKLVRAGGTAVVEPGAPALVAAALPAIPLSGAQTVGVTLPRGTWHLAIKYTSAVPVRLQVGARVVRELPSDTTRPGPWWPGGTITSDGRPMQLIVIAERESRFSRSAFPTSVAGIVAVPDGAERAVPLAKACGRYVDWYRPAS